MVNRLSQMTGQAGHVKVQLRNMLPESSPEGLLLHGNPAEVRAANIPESHVGIKTGTVSYVGNKPIPAENLLKLNSEYILPAHIDQ